MGEKLAKILAPLVEKANGSVLIEAGHFYTEGGVNEQVLAGVQAAANVVEILAGFFAVKAESMLFVDDIKAGIEPFMLQAAVANFVNLGFAPVQVVYESSLLDDGKALVAGLQARSLTKEHQGRLRLKHGWIPLQGKAGVAENPSCEVLDAVLYHQKLSGCGGAVTILPNGYQDQQRKTKVVFEAAFSIVKPNVLVLYHDKNSQIINSDYWG